MVATPVSREVMAALGPGLASLAGPLLTPFVQALTAPLASLAALVAEPAAGRPSPPLTDLATTPYPTSLAQVAGLLLPSGLSPEAARERIAGRGASRRGTPGALVAAVQATLTGGRRYLLVERDGSPYRVALVTYTSETPDPAATAAAALSEKPLGLVLNVSVSPGKTYSQTTAELLTYGQHTATGRTYMTRTLVLP